MWTKRRHGRRTRAGIWRIALPILDVQAKRRRQFWFGKQEAGTRRRILRWAQTHHGRKTRSLRGLPCSRHRPDVESNAGSHIAPSESLQICLRAKVYKNAVGPCREVKHRPLGNAVFHEASAGRFARPYRIVSGMRKARRFPGWKERKPP